MGKPNEPTVRVMVEAYCERGISLHGAAGCSPRHRSRLRCMDAGSLFKPAHPPNRGKVPELRQGNRSGRRKRPPQFPS